MLERLLKAIAGIVLAVLLIGWVIGSTPTQSGRWLGNRVSDIGDFFSGFSGGGATAPAGVLLIDWSY